MDIYSNVDLSSLATKLAGDFNLDLTIVDSDKETQSEDIDLILESKNGVECYAAEPQRDYNSCIRISRESQRDYYEIVGCRAY